MAQISSLSSSSQSAAPAKSRTNIMSPIDREIEQLMKQKGIINEKIASIRSDEKLDSKQKDERIKLLNMDLQLLESQIMQKRMEKAENNKSDKNASSQKESSSKKSEADINQEISGPSMEKLLQASNLHEQLTKMASVRRSLKVEADDLRLEVKKNRAILETDNEAGDEGKSEMRKNLEITVNKSKNEQALDIDKKIYELDRKISEKIEDTIEGIQNDDKQVKVVTEEVSGQKDASVSAQPVSAADTLRPNQDTGKNNIGIDIRV
ncbi:hypothetical protein [Paenibacillus woosongensis]|uniref:FlxA-like protein n=1 Tax=Paenibacillus woosongensis TaxID=307580 RepID=A0ABQ4MRF4_9BACL|nr:hypothetical protein [Paenibacillus woosongensis]GIP58494.1 hypothetical protein J15TS10_23080 [Paenibacillus woosongensis]